MFNEKRTPPDLQIQGSDIAESLLIYPRPESPKGTCLILTTHIYIVNRLVSHIQQRKDKM